VYAERREEEEEEEAEAPGIQNQKQEPHTKLGKNLSDSLVKPPLVQEIGPPPDLDGQYEQ